MRVNTNSSRPLCHRQQTAATLPLMLQKLDGHQSSDAGQCTRTEDREHDYQTRDLTATNQQQNILNYTLVSPMITNLIQGI